MSSGLTLRSVFLAYDLGDIQTVLAEKALLRRALPTLALSDYDVQVSSWGPAALHLQASIAARLATADALVVCVGMETWRNPWVGWEIEYAALVGMPIVGWVLQDAVGCQVPRALDRRLQRGATLLSAVESLAPPILPEI